MKTGNVLPRCLTPRTLFVLLLLSALLALTGCFNLKMGIVESSPVPTQDATVTPQRAEPTASPTSVEPEPILHTLISLGAQRRTTCKAPD